MLDAPVCPVKRQNSGISGICLAVASWLEDCHDSMPHSIFCFLFCIVYRYFYSASHFVSQTEALSVHFSYRKKARLKARERQGKGSRENKRARMWREVLPE